MTSILDYCKNLPSITLDEGDILLKHGDKSHKFYILIDCECDILRCNFLITKVSVPGSMMGEMSSLLISPHV